MATPCAALATAALATTALALATAVAAAVAASLLQSTALTELLLAEAHWAVTSERGLPPEATFSPLLAAAGAATGAVAGASMLICTVGMRLRLVVSTILGDALAGDADAASERRLTVAHCSS